MIKKFFHFAAVASSYVREKSKSFRRSPKWNEFRDQFVAQHAECAACGSKNNLQVHHIKPFHKNPELELQFSNMITLCMSNEECHLKIGHGGSFRTYNPNVEVDAKKYRSSISPIERSTIAESAKINRKM